MSSPYPAVCIHVRTISLYPALTNCCACFITFSGSLERSNPLDQGMIQNVQKLLHPSWIFKEALVRSENCGTSISSKTRVFIILETPLIGNLVSLCFSIKEIMFFLF